MRGVIGGKMSEKIMGLSEFKEMVILKYCKDCAVQCTRSMKMKLEIINFADKKPCRYKKNVKKASVEKMA